MAFSDREQEAIEAHWDGVEERVNDALRRAPYVDDGMDRYDPADEFCCQLTSPSRSTRLEDPYVAMMERGTF